ncbi:hypothetical protein DEU56DRAFT_737751 [Suillus clintonianus]|uniref:uncharacterized protein n=1 Tax=Suillus clintonianus TaxID=1904413 RepID=UPI001B86578D|nr:uncharacterized protein DEU56DRAFT_737751 [Suillus clintonianus]KAG2135428.1 hypothetical protein DEU56DRAFT_737751 [Suillus clintonianus]
MSTLPVTSLLHSLQYQRKPLNHRATSLALLGLIVVSFYIFFIARPSLDLAPIALHSDALGHPGTHGSHPQDKDDHPPSSRLFRLPSSSQRKTVSNANRPQVKLDEMQELAAVAAFVAALPQNMIPRSIDPSQPIDPQLVLDFDTRSPRAAYEVNQIVQDVWSRYPVMLFTKLHHANSREIKQIISNMDLRPPPAIFEVDQREDADVLIPLLHRLTSSTELPLMLIGGKPVGSMDTIRELNEAGELQKLITNAGGVIGGAKKKKGH